VDRLYNAQRYTDAARGNLHAELRYQNEGKRRTK
jgi:hypothetical protein